MIAIDTNVLVRYLVQDDPAQGRAARDLLETLTPADPALVTREVMLETVWVLERAYKFDRGSIVRTLESLLETEELLIEAADGVGLAISRYARGGAGFADQMIVAMAAAAGCSTLFTFDRKAAEVPGATLLEA